MVSQTRLRKMRETPQLSDEKNPDGSHHYPVTPEGFAGRAFTFDESKGSYLPPDTDALPAESDPNATRERPAKDGLDPAMAALAGAAAVGAVQQRRIAQEHQALAARAPNTPQAQYHMAEEKRHMDASFGYQEQERSVHNGAAPSAVYPVQQAMDAPLTESKAAQERMDTLRREKPDLVANMGESAVYDAPAYEDYTERSLFYSEEAAGDPAETPFEGVEMESGPLEYGTHEGDHTPDSEGDMAQALDAHHEHLRSTGDANIARQRYTKLQGKIAELRAKGLPTAAVEQQAAWALQREERAEGLASQAQRVEDGQRWLGREHQGAEIYRRQQDAANEAHFDNLKHANESAEETRARNDAIENAGPEGRRDAPEQVRVAQGAPEAPKQAAARRTEYFDQSPLQAAAAALHATESLNNAPRPAPARSTPSAPPQGARIAGGEVVKSRDVTPGGDAVRPAQVSRAATPSPEDAARVAAARPRPNPDSEEEEEARQNKEISPAHAMAVAASVDGGQPAMSAEPSNETVNNDEPVPGGAIDMAQRGVVQPSALPAYVTAQPSEDGVSYIFTAPPEAVALGFPATTLLGTDDGSGATGVGEQAWAIAGEMEAAIVSAQNEMGTQPAQADGDTPDVPDIGMMVNHKPMDIEGQNMAAERKEAVVIQARRDAVIQHEVAPRDPFKMEHVVDFDAGMPPKDDRRDEPARDVPLPHPQKIGKMDEPEPPAPK